MPATTMDTSQLRERVISEQSRLQRSIERQISQAARRSYEANPEYKKLVSRLARLNRKIHRNHMRQAKQKASEQIYSRKAKQAADNVVKLVEEDKKLVQARDQVVAKKQEIADHHMSKLRSTVLTTNLQDGSDPAV